MVNYMLYLLFHMYTECIGYGGIAITYYILYIIKDLELPLILLSKSPIYKVKKWTVQFFPLSNFFPAGIVAS